jgi:hypothetical protein
MKTALILVVLVLVLALGALGLTLFGNARAATADAHGGNAPASVAAQPAASESADTLARIDALGREVDDLRAQVAALKAGAAREPAAPVVAEKPVEEASTSFVADHRDAILRVIEEDRQEQKRKADEEQRARELQAALARAERTAKEFGLGHDQEKSLADVYILERAKIDDLRTQMRDQTGDPAAMRQSFRELRDWRLNELTTRLGADLAQKINDTDAQAFRGAFGGGGPGGGGGGGGGRRGGNGGNGNGTDNGNRPGG